ILDNNDSLGANTLNVFARNLRMVADSDAVGAGEAGSIGHAIPSPANEVDVQVDRLAAVSTDGIYVREVDDVLVDRVDPITVAQVRFRSTIDSVTFDALEDLRTRTISMATPNELGEISLRSADGTITINPGADASFGIQTRERGNVLLETLAGNGSDIVVNANILTKLGNVTVDARDDVLLNANILVSGFEVGKGRVNLTANNRLNDPPIEPRNDGVIMRATTLIDTFGGNANVTSQNGGDILVSRIDTVGAIAGDIFLKADGSIRDTYQTPYELTVAATIGQNQVTANEASGLSVGDRVQLASAAATQTVTISAIAGNTVTFVEPLTSDFGVATLFTSRLTGNLLDINAGKSAHLTGASVNILKAIIEANERLSEVWQTTNSSANDDGNNFLDRLSATTSNAILPPGAPGVDQTIDGLSVGMRSLRQNFEFQSRFEGDGYALFLKNDKALSVQSINAGDSANPNIYVETLGANNLNLNGSITSTSTSATHGGVVLVAGGKLNHNAGDIVTTAQISVGVYVMVKMIVSSTPLGSTPDLLDSTFYDAAQPATGVNRSTEFVVVSTAADNDAINRHTLQRVAIRFGEVSELGFIAFIGYADGNMEMFATTSNTGNSALPPSPNPNRPSSPDESMAGLFIRSTSFASTFLQSNLLLPTDAVLRRADNLFLFQGDKNADYEDPTSTFEDLTYDSKAILNVKSVGGGGIPMPTNPVMPPVPSPSLFVEAKLIPTVDVIPIIPVELGTFVEKKPSIEVYRVEYSDMNNDGQPDRSELPSSEDIIRRVGGDARGKTNITVKTDDGATVKIDLPQELQPSFTSGAPTSEDVAKIKQAILADPTKPSGAYTIIFEDGNGNRSVLDVFPVRDIPDQSSATDEPILVPATESEQKSDTKPAADPVDKGAMLPLRSSRSAEEWSIRNDGDEPQPRTASVAFLLSSMWLLKRRRKEEPTDAQDQTLEHVDDPTLVGFSRSDRRRRQFLRAIKK
ncbi:MAG: hypothetical protein ABL921_12660, partial [Pirellula sp.]